MAAPPLAVNKEAVKTLAIAIGVRESARQLGIPEATVQAWSAREKWFAKPEPQLLPPTMRPVATKATKSPSEALLDTQAEDSEACKTHALRYAKRTLKHAADLAEVAPDEALTQAPNVASVTKTASMAGAWGADRSDVRINVFSDSSRVIDVESLPSAGDERE